MADDAKASVRGDQANDRREGSKHQRLGEQLPDDPAPACAERVPHEQLALARRCPREHQQGDVAAYQEQQQRREPVDRIDARAQQPIR